MSYIRSPELLGFDKLDLSSDSTVNAGSSETITSTPEPGYLYKVKSIHLNIVTPGGTSSGTHRFDVKHTSPTMTYLTGISAHDGQLRYDFGYWRNADNTELPLTGIEQLLMLNQIVYNHDHPLTIKYTNDTDVNQTNERSIILDVEIYREVL